MTLRDRFEQLQERERKLLIVFLVVLVTMVLLLIPFAVALSVSSQRSENARVREIIQSIVDERVTLSRRQAEAQRVDKRYARKAPALAGFLAQVADRVDVDIPETQDRSTVPAGKSFKVRSTKIRLRRTGLFQLSSFLDKVSQSGYAVSVSKLVIRRRGSKLDEYDAEMEVSAFDRNADSGSDEDEDEE